MVSFDQASLTRAAGIDPWAWQAKLAAGDPAQIEALAAAFYKASGHLDDAHAATKKSHKYVRQGYTVQGASPLDMSALAQREVNDPHVGAASTAKIAKVLVHVGKHLDTAAMTSPARLALALIALKAINTQVAAINQATDQTPDQRNNDLQVLFTQAVGDVRNHGNTIKGLVNHYEQTLASSLRSMADLGFIPPDAVDEGPGDVNPSTMNGTGDGKVTLAAVTNTNHVAGVRQYDSSTQYVDLLNRKMAVEGRLTDTEYQYLLNYNTAIDGHLPKIDAWLHDGATQTAVQRVDGIDPNSPETSAGAVHRRGSIVADGVMNLTKAAEQTTDSGTPANAYGPGGERLGRGGLSGLPQSLQNLLYLNLGKHVPDDPGVSIDPEHPGSTLRAQWDAKTGSWVIANQSTAGGFADLLGNYTSDNVTGGSGFSTALGEAGIRWKQQLNTIQHNTHAYYEAELEHWDTDPNHQGQMQFAMQYAREGDMKDASDYMQRMGWPSDLPPSPYWTSKFGDFSLHTDDTLASDALSTSAHNSTGSANLLLNPADRRAVLGLNWQHDTGASHVLVSGTMPSGNPHSPTNDATVAVMKDAGSDYQHLSKIAAPGVKDALTTIAVDHIDSFAPHDMTQGMRVITLPDGTKVNVVGVDHGTGENYLKLISSFGDKHYAVVQQAGLERGAQYLAAAHGVPHNSAAYNNAYRLATELDGHIAGAGQAQLYDQARSENAGNAAAIVAAHQEYRNELASYNEATTPLKWLTTAVSLGSNIAGVAPPLAEFKVPLDFIRTGLTGLQNTISAPSNPLDDPKVYQHIYDSINHGSTLDQQTLQGISSRTDADLWMTQRAEQIVHHSSAPITAPTGYGADGAPGVTPLSDAQVTRLQHTYYPTLSGTDGPSAVGSQAYEDWAGDTHNQGTFATGNGHDPASAYGSGGSWGNGDTRASIQFGDNQRVNWSYGYDAQQKYAMSRGVIEGPNHPLISNDDSGVDPDTGDDAPRRSVVDYAPR